ncbi:MAG: adenosylhomocysteinase [Halolamina sp.]
MNDDRPATGPENGDGVAPKPRDPTGRDDALSWTREELPVLCDRQTRHAEDRPLDGVTVGVASHLEHKTGVFVESVAAAGADVLATSNDPASVYPDVVEALADREGIRLFVEAGLDDEGLRERHRELLAAEPDFLLDDGAVLLALAHLEFPAVAAGLDGACEQTTTGVHRAEAMAEAGVLECPVARVNHSPSKHRFDNVHGTGESATANVQITTNRILAGRTVVVAGYGYVGRGVAHKLRGIGADTVVTEVDPRKAIAATLAGHRVLPMAEAAAVGDFFVTATGTCDVIRPEHVDRMRDGAVLANAGHFDVEVDVSGIAERAAATTAPEDGVTRYHMPDGRRIDLLAEGRLVNLASPHARGHPAAVMDTTFSLMLAAAVDLREREPDPGVYDVPDAVDRSVARAKCEAMGIDTDALTESQRAYLNDWKRDLADAE